MLEHKCPSCGRSIGYEGLCWLCRAEAERREAQACRRGRCRMGSAPALRFGAAIGVPENVTYV